MSTKPAVLDLGCGNRKRPGTVGIDINPQTAADVVHDLNCFPYPFADSTFDHVVLLNMRLVASGRVRLKPTITHVLNGLESVPLAFEITANKAKYQAINPAQVVLCQ